jgi:hypothetical protein
MTGNHRQALSPFAEGAPELIALGYHPLPIMPQTKRPGEFRGGRWIGMKDWQRFRDRPPSGCEIQLWTRNYSDANMGAVLGSPAGRSQDGEALFVVAIDIDIDDPEAIDSLRRQLPHSPMSKQGKKGETRFYRAPASIKSTPYNRASDRQRMIDLLTGFETRQTVLPPSSHPDTGTPYVWLSGPVAAIDLPIFGEEAKEKMEEALAALGWNPEAEREAHGVKTPRPRLGEHDDDDYFSETKRAALANLDAWFPNLGLYGCVRSGLGYRAVASFRASLAGKRMEDRNLHIGAHPTGIRDWGTDEGYSAIDLVMVAQGVTQPEATSWLRERLGLDGGGVVIALTTGGTRHDADGVVIEDEPAPSPQLPVAVETPTLHELPDVLTRVPGLLGALTDWICDTSRHPQRGLALGAALTLVGTGAGRKFAGPTGSGTHLYVLALARTGAGKDHALKQIARVLHACDMGRHVGPAQFMSWQALVNRLAREPLTLCPMDEFGAFMARINRKSGGSSHEAGMSPIFRSAWGTSFDTMPAIEWAGKESDPIHSPSLSLYGASVHDEFYKSLSGADVSNGFLNRFLVVSTREKPSKVEPKLDRFEVPESIRAGMQAIYGSGSALAVATSNNGRADAPLFIAEWANSPAKDLYEEFCLICEEREEEQPLWGRSAEMSIRLATIRAIGIDSAAPRIEPADMRWGVDLARWSAERMIAETADHMSDTQNQADAQLVLRKIKEAGRIKHGALLRVLQHSLKARDVRDLTDALREAGQISLDKTEVPGGGPQTRWYAAI